ncbi:MAG: ABC-F family ATP-binding cassette domain-containing protein [Butyrivibrio sp.]|nr:ABC-F family ATP-binding cassette domain-containing protein [Butyrivibrio sp.]
MILSTHNICKSFDGVDVLKNVSFHIENNEKAAIVGINGAGKTTLLRIIIGELASDEGEVTFAKGCTFGYLAQNQNIDGSNTIYEELKEVKRSVIDLENSIREAEQLMKTLTGDELNSLMDRYTAMTHQFQLIDGYAWQSEVLGVAKGLGFADEDLDKKISTLSGGQKTRVALGKLLLQKPDLIILDEPTNHLDMNSIKWLETYLLNYKGAVLIVSHDRYFLDKIAGKVIEIDGAKATSFIGNYSDYAVKKEQLRAIQWHAYINQQQEIKHQEAVIEKLKSFNREKSIKRAESREKMLDKIEVLDKPLEIRDDMRISLTPSCVSGKDVMQVENIAKSFGNEHLFKDISFEVKRGERIAIIGDNGTGKTTMLKMINGVESLDDGKITLGTKVHIGYYDQEHHVLHDEKTLFEEISDDYPSLNNTQIRNTLAAFLFTGEDVFKRIGDLSGGEKGRVSLAKLMLSEANFLILDEPTNHLDITSKEILESALCGYEGTVLYVSHDRYFINKTATRILDLTHGTMVPYIGNYDYYLEHSPEQMARLFPNDTAPSGPFDNRKSHYDTEATGTTTAQTLDSQNAASSNSGQLDWKAQKEEQAKRRKKEAALKKCEDTIAELEARNDEINEEMSKPEVGSDLAKLRSLSDEQIDIQSKLEALYEEWEELSE